MTMHGFELGEDSVACMGTQRACVRLAMSVDHWLHLGHQATSAHLSVHEVPPCARGLSDTPPDEAHPNTHALTHSIHHVHVMLSPQKACPWGGTEARGGPLHARDMRPLRCHECLGCREHHERHECHESWVSQES